MVNINVFSTVDLYDNMRQKYGNKNTFLLRINSRKPDKNELLPDPWSQFIDRTMQNDDVNLSTESSPNINRSFHDSLKSNEEVNSGNTLAYHPLSPEGETISVSSRKNFK